MTWLVAIVAGVLVAWLLLLAILWVISPIDPIPEFLPLVGQLDDVIVIIVALRYVRHRMGREELRGRWTGSEAGFVVLSTIMG